MAQLDRNFPKKNQTPMLSNPLHVRFLGTKLKGLVVLIGKISNTTQIELISTPNNLTFSKNLRSWRDCSDEICREVYSVALRSLANYQMVAFTLNLSDTTEKAIKKQRNLNYPRDTLKAVLKECLPDDNQNLYFLAAEKTKEGRLHFHGAFALPADQNFELRLNFVRSELERRLSKRYRQRYDNKRLVARPTHTRIVEVETDDGTFVAKSKTTSITASWISYCTKETGSLVDEGALTNDFAASQDLRSLSKTVWETMRNLVAGNDAGVPIMENKQGHLESAPPEDSGYEPQITELGEQDETTSTVKPLEGETTTSTPPSQKISFFSGFADRISVLILTLVLLTWFVLPPMRARPTRFESEDWPKVFLFAREDPLNPGTSLRYFRAAWHQC